MIKLVRLDERLIHGQIATKWSKHTNVDHIVVADDDAASNPVVKKTLMIAAPGNIRTAIKSVDEAITLLNDDRCKPMSILVIAKNPKNINRLIQNVPEIHEVNIGNFGRVEPKHTGYDRKPYGLNLYIDDLELEEFKKIANADVHAYYQTMPEDIAEDLKKLLG